MFYALGLCKQHYYQRPEIKAYYQRPEIKARKKAYYQRPENSNRVTLVVAIKKLEAIKTRTPVEEERLACYQRAWELNVLDGSLKKGVVSVPLCAINAGFKEKK